MSRKKIIGLCILGVICIAVIVGCVFCIKRPDYVKEAIDILFKNELPY